MFEHTFFAGWGDMDFNSHMRNTAYLDRSADLRMIFFSAHGFPMREFLRRKLGPVIQKDEVEYFREVHLLEEIRATLALAGISEDGSRFTIQNEFFRADGKRAAKVVSAGGWLDLEARKLVPAPPELLEAMSFMPKTEDFRELPSSVR